MSLADEMRRVSKSVANCDEEFKGVYKSVLDKIKKAAEEGEHEIVFGIMCSYSNPNYDRYKRMVIRKLEDEGFRYVYGYQIGKGTGNSMTDYVVW